MSILHLYDNHFLCRKSDGNLGLTLWYFVWYRKYLDPLLTVWIHISSWKCFLQLITTSINLQYHLWIVTIRCFTGSLKTWTLCNGALPVIPRRFGCPAHLNATFIKFHRISWTRRRTELWIHSVLFCTSSVQLQLGEDRLSLLSFAHSFPKWSVLHRGTRGYQSLGVFSVVFMQGFSKTEELPTGKS